MSNAVDELLQQPGIWRAGQRQKATGRRHLATGHPELDGALPGGGWPDGALTEILHEHSGIGELQLLMPLLCRLSHEGRWIAFIAPPYLPYAPALAAQGIDLSRVLLVHPRSGSDALWAVEQALRAGTCGAVLAWPRKVDSTSLRRLQLAAEAGSSLGLVFRREAEHRQASPAAVRLHLSQQAGRMRLELLKSRGGGRRQVVYPSTGDSGSDAPPATSGQPPAAAQPVTGDSARPAATAVPAPPRPRRTSRPLARHHGRRRAAQLDLPLP